MKGLKGAANLRRYCCTLTCLEDLDELIDALITADQAEKLKNGEA